MHGSKFRSIAVLSAASLVAQPLTVLPGAQASPVWAVEAGPSPNVSGTPPPPARFSSVAAGVGTNSVSPATVVPFTPAPVALVPVTALSAAAIETQRGAIAQIMIELGEGEDRARQAAMELTADDLAVLLANPKMMQKAGDLALIVGALIIVGVIVALVVLADSSTVIILS